MNIIPAFSANNSRVNLKQNNFNKSYNANNTSNLNTYKLPGYNVSFGAMIQEYNKNPGVLLNREEREEIKDAAIAAMSYSGDPDHHDMEILDKIFEKYGENTTAIQYLAHFALRQNTNDRITNKQNAMYLNAILDTINNHFADNEDKRKKNLDAMLCVKNIDGNTLMHAYTKGYEMTSVGLLPHLLESLSDFPDLQLKALEQKNKYGKTVGQIVTNHRSEDGIAINDTLYKLCARSINPDRNHSIELLSKNERVLNEGNKEVLEALQSDECICEGEEFNQDSEKIISLDAKLHANDEKYKHTTTDDNCPSIMFSSFEAIDG